MKEVGIMDSQVREAMIQELESSIRPREELEKLSDRELESLFWNI